MVANNSLERVVSSNNHFGIDGNDATCAEAKVRFKFTYFNEDM